MFLTAAVISTSLLIVNSGVAYPGMQPTQKPVSQTGLDKITILPQPFPIAQVNFSQLNNDQIDFEAFKGKVVVVNMWATWCPPCVRELPALDRLANKIDQSQYTLLPISIDADGKEIVQPFLESIGLAEFESYFDPQQNLREVFPLETIPATFILNPKGELVAYVRSYVDWDDENAIAFLKQFYTTTEKVVN
ncbi:TlpA disulfide reductase family protein [Shewanella subflava]|uniref:TlpA family protein disulfide reductase n=1 Tax=Shewanella subflava TaxID=2986476 RepID=A0ABT3I6H2_9GAMM|nr:TlpA disulfide reductase family protein [Shewanella subflava]MCW3171663.1 TlpA family protein disulfide reductase [Shewanella subflava]